ncbi:unnamed protein product [Blepharisma stoltei]|uniref:Uncharacterized protein n=1 Tax=Blepharisma stoltei TaxID=1481888 RepID=A0AAU9ISH9_9CILI|nr:unnamed protein product [Blepharisma stoltei]
MPIIISMEYLIDLNRGSLRTIFQIHSSEKQTISYNEFIKFCTIVRIYPDMLSSFELKRLVMKTANSHTYIDRKVELGYLQFEKLLVLIAEHCFDGIQTNEKLGLMFMHIKNPCKQNYQVEIFTSPDNYYPKEDFSPITIQALSHSIERPGIKTTSFIKSNGHLGESTHEHINESSIKRVINKSASLKIPFSSMGAFKNQSILSPKFIQPTPKNINKKVKQLYALISPRNSSSRNISSISPKNKNESSISIDHSVMSNKSKSIVDLSKLPSNLHISPEANSIQKSNDKDKLDQLKSVFLNFKSNFEEKKAIKRPCIGAQMQTFIKNIHKRRYESKIVLKFAFENWKLKAMLKG